jgi:hypothetical protein
MFLKLYGTIRVLLLELIVRNIARYPQSATLTSIRYQPAIRYLVPLLQASSTLKVQTFSDSVQYLLPQGSEKYDNACYYSPRNDVCERDRLREAGEHQTWGEYSKNNLSAI